MGDVAEPFDCRLHLHGSAAFCERVGQQHGGVKGIGGQIVLQTHTHSATIGWHNNLLNLVGGRVVSGDALITIPLSVTGVRLREEQILALIGGSSRVY